MKTAPGLLVGLTACISLAAGFVLAAEDQAVFDPQQAMVLVLADAAKAAVAPGADNVRPRVPASSGP